MPDEYEKTAARDRVVNEMMCSGTSVGQKLFEKRVVDVQNSVKEHWWRAVRRGDGRRALDWRTSWQKPRDVTPVTPDNAAEASGRALWALYTNAHRKFGFGNLRPALTRNSEEAEPFQTISQNRAGESIGFIFVLHDNDTKMLHIGPNYHAPTKKALKMTTFGGYSTSKGIYEVQEHTRFRKCEDLRPQIHGQCADGRQRVWRRDGRAHIVRRPSKEGWEMSAERAWRSDQTREQQATSAHGAYIKHRSGGQWAHEQQRLGANGAGIGSQAGEGGSED
ncbi:hypothetical protein B0H14DRAFT_3689910 [Mycena olivaceomarginata]|nr:hypothetical protein B0H14DRAFT_3689910 [Mycena olivaceomarginata]